MSFFKFNIWQLILKGLLFYFFISGFSIGSIVGGIIYKIYGGRMLFIITSVVALTCCLAHSVLFNLYFKHSLDKPSMLSVEPIVFFKQRSKYRFNFDSCTKLSFWSLNVTNLKKQKSNFLSLFATFLYPYDLILSDLSKTQLWQRTMCTYFHNIYIFHSIAERSSSN